MSSLKATPLVLSTAAAEADARALRILETMRPEEKIDMLGGVRVFFVRGNPRLGLPELKMADGPLGVRASGPSTAYAAGIALAASFDVDLARRVGSMIGRDARARGVHFLLGPGVNIYRSPLCGRNFEYFGEDPFLAAHMAVAYIEGVQAQGVSATVKHFMGNNSEHNRHHTSSEIDERTMREIYLPAFEAAVREARVGAVMNAYNLVGGVHMTQHELLNQQLLKHEWGFDGVLMSDWEATYDAVAAANAGLDLEMPWARFMNRASLEPALQAGTVTMATIDDKVRRVLRTAIRFGWLDREQRDSSWPLYSQQGRELALETARASMVLLKNEGDLLPLERGKIDSIALIGPNAYPAVASGGGSAQVRSFVAVSCLEGLSSALAGSAKVTFCRGVVPLREVFESPAFTTSPSGEAPGLAAEYFTSPDLTGAPRITRIDSRVSFDCEGADPWPCGLARQFSARWTGYFLPPVSGAYRFSVASYGLDDYTLFVDGRKVLQRAGHPQPIQHWVAELAPGKACEVRLEYRNVEYFARLGMGVFKVKDIIAEDVREIAAKADVAVVLAGFDPSNEGEGSDRTFQLPDGQDELIEMVRDANAHTIVVLNSGGGVDMTRWVNDVPAIIQAWYPGQEGGRALAELLLGDLNPSGKLPVTFERRLEDGASYRYYAPKADGRIDYAEGIFVGYRHFDRERTQPLFPFGHGLSFTTFSYSGLSVEPKLPGKDDPVVVAFDVSNRGTRAGAAVAQVYVGDGHAPVPRPPKELKGFAKVALGPGESKRVQIILDRRAFSYFDSAQHAWTYTPGDFDVLVGSSSQRIELRGKVTLC